MALSKIDVANMVTGATPIANGGTGLTTNALKPNSIPLMYNGNMEVSQRSTSVTGLTNGNSGYHTVDRWKWHENGSPSSAWTMTQEALTSGNAYANGFNNALKIDCTTAQGSLGAGDTLHIEQRFEKQDLGAFKKGTANAQKFTIAFWVKATKTGTNIVELQDEGNDRAVSATYTISTTDTWEHKVVTFPADTTGNFGTSNALGLIIRFYIFAGSNYTSSSLQTSWGASSTAARANGQVNNADSTSNNWHLTGVQLEVGEYTSSTLPPFQHESYDENKKRCARYYYKVAEYGADGLTYQSIGTGYYKNTDQWRVTCYLPVRPRTNPSLDSTSGTDYYINDIQGVNDTLNSFTLTRNNADIVQVIHNASEASGTIGQAGETTAYSSGAYIAFDAEL
jgi:hypothetical protein